MIFIILKKFFFPKENNLSSWKRKLLRGTVLNKQSRSIEPLAKECRGTAAGTLWSSTLQWPLWDLPVRHAVQKLTLMRESSQQTSSELKLAGTSFLVCNFLTFLLFFSVKWRSVKKVTDVFSYEHLTSDFLQVWTRSSPKSKVSEVHLGCRDVWGEESNLVGHS